MKRYLCFFIVLLTACLVWAAVGTTQIIKTNSSTSSPVQLTTNTTRCRTIVFTGYKAARTVNTGNMWIQYANSTNDAGGLKLQSGQTLSITGGPGGLDASDFYLDPETANDGVVATLFQ